MNPTFTLHSLQQRLSLRPPQQDSLHTLHTLLQQHPALVQRQATPDQGRDLAGLNAAVAHSQPTFQDFERAFPSLCFALATGVGKTRLMGAFIAYLHAVYGLRHFLVLAPNLTIYEKLIQDFSPNTPKYVFQGLREFASQVPEVITGDNFESSGQTAGLLQGVQINVFNIAKLNSEVRGGKEPRIKRMAEMMGTSYFSHLQSQDLVLLMDESHRYRASAGIKALNDLNPLLGLELTATPFTEEGAGKTKAFKNVVLHYPLATAMDDGYVKEPTVVSREDFHAQDHNGEDLERIKLEDGMRLHELTKVELETYAKSTGQRQVKPFVLIIASDTAHAQRLLKHIQSPSFFAGSYADKVIQVDSSQKGQTEEDNTCRLLAVERFDEPTEIVIHVNMLKEGWDVTNLYTIIPLRAAHARTLIEQSIGRGLRLPYGTRTGVEAVDRLSIIAHDRFSEILAEARREDSPIRLKTLLLPSDGTPEVPVSVAVTPKLVLPPTPPALLPAHKNPQAAHAAQEVHAAHIAHTVAQVVYAENARTLPSSQQLNDPQTQAYISKKVIQKLAENPQLGGLLVPETSQSTQAAVLAGVQAFSQQLEKLSIDLPRITVQPKGEVQTGYHDFVLNLDSLNLKPSTATILGSNLRDQQTSFRVEARIGIREARPEDHLIHALLDFPDLDYHHHAALLQDLSHQVIGHFRKQGHDEAACFSLVQQYCSLIAKNLYSQMQPHFWRSASDYEATVHQGLMPLKTGQFSQSGAVRGVFDAVPAKDLRQTLFTGFQHCLYEQQKFDSEAERRLAQVLEREQVKWFKPLRDQLQIYYQCGSQQRLYQPDFIAETHSQRLMIEVKASNELHSPEVQAKQKAAKTWCQHANGHAQSTGGKPWAYWLIAHDRINDTSSLSGLGQCST